MDSTGRWSHWSPAVEFVAGPPTEPFPEQEHLRITEIMYHPGVAEELEFIEFFNTGPEPLALDPASLSGPVALRFADGPAPSPRPWPAQRPGDRYRPWSQRPAECLPQGHQREDAGR